MQPLSIHTAQPDNAALLSQLYHELAAAIGEPVCAMTPAAMQDALNHDHIKGWLIYWQNEVAGFALSYPGYDFLSASSGMHVADIYIRPAHQRRGLGRALMAHIASWAMDHGHDWLSLTVLRHNLAAQAFYRALGFSKAEIHLMAIGRQGMSRLTKQL